MGTSSQIAMVKFRPAKIPPIAEGAKQGLGRLELFDNQISFSLFVLHINNKYEKFANLGTSGHKIYA